MVVGLFFFVDTILAAVVLALGCVGIVTLVVALGVEGMAMALVDDVLHERGVVRVAALGLAFRQTACGRWEGWP